MAKTGGLGDDLYVAGFRIGGDIQSLTVSGGPAQIDVTDITQSAHARLGGQRTGAIKVVAYHDPAAGQSHAVYSPLPTADQIVTYLRGQAVGNPAACCNAKQLDYNATRANTGALTFAVDAESNGFGTEWGVQLTAGLRTDTTATAGPFYDQGAAGAGFGAQAYLQLISITGTSVDVTVQHATTSGGAYTTIIDFGAQAAAGSFRGTSAGAVNEFLKVTTTGTFTNAQFMVAFMLNPVAVVF
jgi:hypothetical protein